MAATYYDLLGISQSSTPVAIKTAYKKIAMRQHPDRGGDAEAFKALSTAYATLSDPALRYEYDRSLNRSIFRPSIRCVVDVSLAELVSGEPKTIAIRLGGKLATADVTITPVMDTGTRIIVSMDGGWDINAILRVDSGRFRKQGLDLQTTVPVSLWTLLAGGEILVDNPAGIQYNVKIPANTVPGSILKLKGCGLEHNGRRGDLSVELEMIYPKTLSPELSAAILSEQSLIKGHPHATQSRD